MTHTTRRPMRFPTIRALRADLDAHFGSNVVTIASWNAKQVSLGGKGLTDESVRLFVAGWFLGRRSR